jgi:hypothetical protein
LQGADAFDAWADAVGGRSSLVRVGAPKKKGKDLAHNLVEAQNRLTASLSLDEVKRLLGSQRTLTVQLKSAGFWNLDFPIPKLSILTGVLYSANTKVAMYANPLEYWGQAHAKIEEGGRFRLLVAVGQDYELFVVIAGKETQLVPKVRSSPDLGGEISLGRLQIPCAEHLWGTHEVDESMVA